MTWRAVTRRSRSAAATRRSRSWWSPRRGRRRSTSGCAATASRVLRALRDTDSYHVQAFALEVLRKRALSSPRALLLSLQRRAESLGARR